jgi:hypothetical protein
MENPRFTLEEFNTLFPGPFQSERERLREYRSFLLVLEQLDRVPTPELSARERAEIFRRSRPGSYQDRPSIWTWLAFLKRPAAAFALGIVIGCVLMFACMKDRTNVPRFSVADAPFTVERIGHARAYEGKVLRALYPQVENPRMTVERAQETSEPKRVLHGTLDNGEIYVAWNL